MVTVALFCYTRLEHTVKVIESLEHNSKKIDAFYIFQDGCDDAIHRSEWLNLNKYLKTLNYENLELIIAEKNKGLANSIVDGLDYVFKYHEDAIVLEDDCVTHPLFLQFMSDALEKYRYEKRVYNINGYSNPVEVKENGYAAYFIGRTSSWGWATWRDRWKEYKSDYRAVYRLKHDREKAEQFHIWGEDLESYVIGNVTGKCNSWATFWSLTVLEKEGLCLCPYKSLVKNIGFDGTGTHCGTDDIETNLLEWEYRDRLALPDKIELVEDYKKSYRDYYHWTPDYVRNAYYNEVYCNLIEIYQKALSLGDFLKTRKINNVAIFGKNKIAEIVIKDIKKYVSVENVIVSRNAIGNFCGIKVISLEQAINMLDLIVVIPGYDIERIQSETTLKCVDIKQFTRIVLSQEIDGSVR